MDFESVIVVLLNHNQKIFVRFNRNLMAPHVRSSSIYSTVEDLSDNETYAESVVPNFGQ